MSGWAWRRPFRSSSALAGTVSASPASPASRSEPPAEESPQETLGRRRGAPGAVCSTPGVAARSVCVPVKLVAEPPTGGPSGPATRRPRCGAATRLPGQKSDTARRRSRRPAWPASATPLAPTAQWPTLRGRARRSRSHAYYVTDGSPKGGGSPQARHPGQSGLATVSSRHSLIVVCSSWSLLMSARFRAHSR